MERLRRWFYGVFITLLITSVVSIIVVFVISEGELNRVQSVAISSLASSPGKDGVAAGERLVRGPLGCTRCHGVDLGGTIMADTLVGRFVAPNLTLGRGSEVRQFQQADWVRAIRHGLDVDGRGLWLMPTDRYGHLTDDDLGSVISYLTQVPPVDRDLPGSQIGFLGRMLMALGKLELVLANRTAHDRSRPAQIEEGGLQHGRYLAKISGCGGCHSIVPGSAVNTLARFTDVLRDAGNRAGQTADKATHGRAYARLTAGQVGALWLYWSRRGTAAGDSL
jgi:hypothetical protein